MRSGLSQKITPHAALLTNAFVSSLASRLLLVLYDENCANLGTDAVLHAPDPLSHEHKQRRDSLSHKYTGGGAHQTMQLHRRGEGTGGRLSSQMSVLGRCWKLRHTQCSRSHRIMVLGAT